MRDSFGSSARLHSSRALEIVREALCSRRDRRRPRRASSRAGVFSQHFVPTFDELIVHVSTRLGVIDHIASKFVSLLSHSLSSLFLSRARDRARACLVSSPRTESVRRVASTSMRRYASSSRRNRSAISRDGLVFARPASSSPSSSSPSSSSPSPRSSSSQPF